MKKSFLVSGALTALYVAVPFASSVRAFPQATSTTPIEVVESTENRAPALRKSRPLHFGKTTNVCAYDSSRGIDAINPLMSFGPSLTDSSAWLLDRKLTPEQRKETFDQLFDPKSGIGLSILAAADGRERFCDY